MKSIRRNHSGCGVRPSGTARNPRTAANGISQQVVRGAAESSSPRAPRTRPRRPPGLAGRANRDSTATASRRSVSSSHASSAYPDMWPATAAAAASGPGACAHPQTTGSSAHSSYQKRPARTGSVGRGQDGSGTDEPPGTAGGHGAALAPARSRRCARPRGRP
ncbi:hypothetical protein ACFQY7_36260 [Actinomadura luteofluorescens]|uniref:hypothetical protein n=1 Tax=Actinomadura luteofluorescens TaxID=46163 RepID=UPI0036381809